MRLLSYILFASVFAGCGATVAPSAQPGTTQISPATQSGMIRGVVRNEHGWELSEIAVLAVSNDGRGSRLGYSDRAGIYAIDDLAPGVYTLSVHRGHAVVLEQTVRIAGGGSRDVHLRVPAVFGDRPDQRNRPIVDRSLLRSRPIRGR